MHTPCRAYKLLVVGVTLVGSACLSQDRYPVRQLTSAPAQEGFPFWSPDGQAIVYSRVDTAGLTGLWMVPAVGGEPRQFTKEIGEHPVWSPDGHYILFDAEYGNCIKIVSSRGGSPIRIVPDTVKIFRGGNPNWSPDGSRFVFKEGPNLRVLDLSQGTAPILFRSPGGETGEGSTPVSCCWTRNGKEILFWLRPPGSRESALCRLSLSGGWREILPVTPGVAYRYADVSPDGSLLAYTRCEGRTCDIWVMPSGGGEPVRLTTHPALDESPRWSPDGTQIAFTSTRSRSFDVWVMHVDGEDLRRELERRNPRQ